MTPDGAPEFPRWRLYLTHTLHNGCNLLGVYFLFAGIVGLMACIGARETTGPGLGNLCLAGMLWVLTVADVAWRLRLNRGSVKQRLVAPSAGGCLAQVPAWSIYWVLTLGVCVYALLWPR